MRRQHRTMVLNESVFPLLFERTHFASCAGCQDLFNDGIGISVSTDIKKAWSPFALHAIQGLRNPRFRIKNNAVHAEYTYSCL